MSLLPLFHPSWILWGFMALVSTQIIIALVTVFFHRVCAHRSVTLAMPLYRLCNFMSWFMMGMDPQEFAAVHRKHHAHCDRDADPHSPVNHGWWGVLLGGVSLYRQCASDPKVIEKYGKGLPKDPMDAFYKKHSWLGLLLNLAILSALFGFMGILLWTVNTLWIPFWAAGVINGIGHHAGYRNHQTDDLSTNLVPWGIWLGGEELHNNHHAFPASARFSCKPWEVDAGWGLVRLLATLGWAEVRSDAASGVNQEMARIKFTSHRLRAPKTEASGKSHRGLGSLIRDRNSWLTRFQESIGRNEKLQEALHRHKIPSWRALSAWADRKDWGRLSSRRARRLSLALKDPLIAKVHNLETDLRRFWRERGQAKESSVKAWVASARSLQWRRLDAFADRVASLLDGDTGNTAALKSAV